jgi:glycosyltransferase involved in cell wall biosynthesis
MRLIALVTDAFGGRGGIARFNRDLLRALCAHPECEKVVALPRIVPDAPESNQPKHLTYRIEAADGKLPYAFEVMRHVLDGRSTSFDAVICGHIHLLPMAVLAAQWQRIPLLLVVHGIEARTPSDKALANWLVSQTDHFVAASHHTSDRFVDWSGVDDEKGHVIPTGVTDPSRFAPGPKPDTLLDRYELAGRTVLMTLSRLPVQEKRKGHDEVLEMLPDLVEERPDLAYLICGDGDDRPRLEAKTRRLGLSDRVVFAGYVPESEKVDHYRLADAFVMPGRTEGFGIVYLEALACGIPVVASSADASQEAVRGGELGVVVDPDDPADLKRGILEALAEERGTVPEGLGHFSKERFIRRWNRVVDDLFVP